MGLFRLHARFGAGTLMPAALAPARRTSADDRVKEQDGARARCAPGENRSSCAAAVEGGEHACAEPGKHAENEHDGSSLAQKGAGPLAVHIYSDSLRRRRRVSPRCRVPVLTL